MGLRVLLADGRLLVCASLDSENDRGSDPNREMHDYMSAGK